LSFGQIGDEGIFAADHDGQSIGTDAELDDFAAFIGTGFGFFVFDCAAGVGDVGFGSGTEALEPSARANAIDRDIATLAIFAEDFGHGFAQRIDR